MTKYVDSNATGGNDDGTSWTDAYLTIQQALTNASSSEEVWVAAGSTPHNETFTAGNVTLNCVNGFHGTEVKVISIDPSDDSYDPVSTPQLYVDDYTTDNLYLTGWQYWIGIGIQACIFNPNYSSNTYKYHRDLYMEVGIGLAGITSGGGYAMYGGYLKHLATAQSYHISNNSGAHLYINGLTVLAGTDATPNSIINAQGDGVVICEGCDFSAITGMTGYVILNSNAEDSFIKCIGCKLPSDIGFTLIGNLAPGAVGILSGCGSTNENTNVELTHRTFEGTSRHDTSVYLDASDDDDSYSLSLSPNTSYIEDYVRPFRRELASILFDASAGDQIKVNLIYDSAVVYQNNDIWIEVEYPDASSPLLKTVSTQCAFKETPGDISSNSESWVESMSSPNKRHCLTPAISDGKLGMAKVFVCLGEDVTTTVWFDTAVVIV